MRSASLKKKLEVFLTLHLADLPENAARLLSQAHRLVEEDKLAPAYLLAKSASQRSNIAERYRLLLALYINDKGEENVRTQKELPRVSGDVSVPSPGTRTDLQKAKLSPKKAIPVRTARLVADPKLLREPLLENPKTVRAAFWDAIAQKDRALIEDATRRAMRAQLYDLLPEITLQLLKIDEPVLRKPRLIAKAIFYGTTYTE